MLRFLIRKGQVLISPNISVQNDDALAVAVKWVESRLLGSIATSIAILAVATLGAALLWGRSDIRSGGRVVLGAYILFGAPVIVYELNHAPNARETARPDLAPQMSSNPAAPAMPRNAPAHDPYAGAAVPQLQ